MTTSNWPTATQVKEEAAELQGLYNGRNENFARWFRLLHQVDELAEENMQSFVGNDPRTLWNMGTFLLQPRPLNHKISRIDGLPFTSEQELAATLLQRMFTRVWEDKNKAYQRRGGGTFWWDVIGTMLATGWYAIPFGHTADGKFIVDKWEPAQVYPELSDDDETGVARVARIREMSWSAAHKIAKKAGWHMPGFPAKSGMGTQKITLTELWKDDGEVSYTVMADNTVIFHEVNDMDSIPGLFGGIAGIPDIVRGQEMAIGFGKTTGSTISGADLDMLGSQGHRTVQGQSIMASNERVYNSLNKLQSFVLQLIRDTANPKTWEKSEGNKAIVQSPEEFFKRGAHFRMGPNDDMGVLPMPSIPVEIQQLLFSYRNMIQRGGFSDATFGNITGEVTAILLSQAAESAQQILSPFHEAVMFIVTTIEQSWLDFILDNPTWPGLTDAEQEAVAEIKKEGARIKVTVSYSIKIPGDLAARLNTAKLASPNFELSPQTVMELFVHEVPDARAESARVRAAAAEKSEIFTQVDVVAALKKAARALEEINPESAKLFAAAAAAELAKIAPQGQAPRPEQQRQAGPPPTQVGPPPTQAGPPGVDPNTLPSQEQPQGGQQ